MIIYKFMFSTPCSPQLFTKEFFPSFFLVVLQPVELEGFGFGTRSVTVLAVPRDGSPAELREQYLTNDGAWAEERHRFHMRLAAHLPKPD